MKNLNNWLKETQEQFKLYQTNWPRREKKNDNNGNNHVKSINNLSNSLKVMLVLFKPLLIV